jgi:hypothetical protein
MIAKIIISSILLFSLIACQPPERKQDTNANPSDVAKIKEVLAKQVAAWNDGDIDGFMQGYWKSDSLLFIGSKVTYGWDSTLVRYKRSYPDKATMGILKFEIMRVDFISNDSYLVTGRYFLKREKDAPSGIFTLLVRNINSQWVVVHDHTS